MLCLWIGAKLAYRALFQFAAYRWITLRLAKLAMTTWSAMKTETSEGMRLKGEIRGSGGQDRLRRPVCVTNGRKA
jgi:hypothetical protein